MLSGNNTPFAFSYSSALVAYPSYIRTAYGNNSIRMVLSYNGVISVPIINLFFAVFTFTAGTVKPEAEYIPVVFTKLCKLRNEKVIVLICTVCAFVSVPGLKINAELKTVFFTAF